MFCAGRCRVASGPEEIVRKTLCPVMGRQTLRHAVDRHKDIRDVRRGPGSGSDQIADSAANLSVPVGMQLGDRGITDQPDSG